MLEGIITIATYLQRWQKEELIAQAYGRDSVEFLKLTTLLDEAERANKPAVDTSLAGVKVSDLPK